MLSSTLRGLSSRRRMCESGSFVQSGIVIASRGPSGPFHNPDRMILISHQFVFGRIPSQL